MSSPSISVMNCGRAFNLASHLAPVVFCPPIARERLHRRELHALGRICDRFPFRPLCRVDAPAQFVERLLGSSEAERADRVGIGRSGRKHSGSASSCRSSKNGARRVRRKSIVGHHGSPWWRKPPINYHPNELLFQRHGRTFASIICTKCDWVNAADHSRSARMRRPLRAKRRLRRIAGFTWNCPSTPQ